MKKENKVWTLVGPVVVLSVIALVITGALALTNQATAPVIAAAEQRARDESMQIVLPDGQGFKLIEGLTGLPETVLPQIYEAENGAGYVIFASGKGFGGNINMIAGLDTKGAIVGTKILTHSETEGIGTKVTADGSLFQQQLPGMTSVDGIEATSGATVSSNGVKGALQAIFDAYVVITGGTVEVEVAQAPANLTDDVLAGYYPGAAFTDVPGGKVSDAGTVVYAAEQGMMGPVPVAVCFDTNGAILGVVVDASAETPDLGTLAGEKEFTDQFIGATSADGVDAVAGATITSDAVKSGVNAAIANLSTVKGAG